MNTWAERGLTADKFIGIQESRRLRSHLAAQHRKAMKMGNLVPVRHWMEIHIALDAGLRVSEICDLRVEDVCLTDEYPHLFVHRQKGGSYGSGKVRSRRVVVSPELAEHLQEYLEWKKSTGESTDGNTPLICSPRGGHMTRQAVYLAFKKAARECGLPGRYTIHSCRHTYAVRLYKASNHNLRMVQKQLGHSKIEITTVYADALLEDTLQAIKQLNRADG